MQALYALFDATRDLSLKSPTSFLNIHQDSSSFNENNERLAHDVVSIS
jgi:hypothetical protein